MHGPDRYRELQSEQPGWFANGADSRYQILTADADVAAAQEVQTTRLAARGEPAEWARVGVLFEDQYALALRDAVRRPDGSLGTYIRIFNKPLSRQGVVILASHNGKLILIKQFRHATRRWHWQFARGFAEPEDLSCEHSAQREIAEEIGAETHEAKSMGSICPDTGLLGTVVQAMFAVTGPPKAAAIDEGIAEIKEVTKDEFLTMVRRGEIDDGFTLAAFMMCIAHEWL